MSNMNVCDVKVCAFTKSDYVIPFKMLYTQVFSIIKKKKTQKTFFS